MKGHTVKMQVPQEQYQQVKAVADRVGLPVSKLYKMVMSMCLPMFLKSIEATETDDVEQQEMLLAQGVIQALKKME